MKQKWRNRALQRGVVIDKARGYVYVRFKRQGVIRKELIGRTTDLEVIDKANFRAEQLRTTLRAAIPGFEAKRERLLVEDAADLFQKLHGEKRESKKGAEQFRRHVRLIKARWSGRFVDTISADDLRDFREWRKRGGGINADSGKTVSESTINRVHTAIVTMFNRLVEWRRTGQIPKGTLLPEENPGKGVRKVSEDRFVRERLLSDAEYQALWASAHPQLRRIILAEMNLPLRLADLRSLSKKNINHAAAQFRGVQAKTGKEYTLPINEALWGLIRTAPGDQILDFTAFAHRWRVAVRGAGLVGLQFRDLRRTAATTLHNGGVPLKTISVMLGHSAITTTIRYLGLREENLRQAGDLLAAKYRAVSVSKSRKSVPESVPSIKKYETNKTKEQCVM